MYKKRVLFFWISLLFGTTIAQSPLITPTIEAKFCNDTISSNEIDLVGIAWESLPLCIELTNISPIDVSVNVDFLDSIITEDTFKNRGCNAADRPKVYFGNFMEAYEKTINIKAGETIQKIYTIKFPIGFKWLSHWCFAYNVLGETNNPGWWVVNIIVRTVKFIDILVTDKQITSDLYLVGKPIIYKNEHGKFVIKMTIQNKWNVDQKLNLSWNIHNILWYNKELIFQENITIPSNKEIDIETHEFTLPVYKWFFVVHSIVGYMPQLNFNITNANIEELIISWWKIVNNDILFVFSRGYILMLGFFIVFLSLVYKAFFRKNISK